MSSTATPQSPTKPTATDPTVRRLGIAEVFDVDSSSTEGKVYRVSLNPDRCNCRARVECKHIRKARRMSRGVLGHTTALAEAAASHYIDTQARDISDPCSLHLPRAVGAAFITARGWRAVSTGGWVSPSGSHYWVLAEAVEIALIAEVAEMLR